MLMSAAKSLEVAAKRSVKDLLCYLKVVIVNFASIYMYLRLFFMRAVSMCMYVCMSVCLFVCLPTLTGTAIKFRNFWEVVNAKTDIQEAYSEPSQTFKKDGAI